MLPVGHTHEDIDARFSLVSRLLFQNDAETVEDFLNLLEKPNLIKTVYDVKAWLIPTMPEYITGVSEPLHYKFEKINGKVSIFYKGTQNSEWKEAEHGFINKHPSGKPKVVAPDFTKMDEIKLLKLIENNKSLFKNKNIKEYWKKMIKQLQQKQSNEKWILPDLPKQICRKQSPAANLPDDIIQLLDKENRDPLVIIFMYSCKLFI